MSVSTLAGRYAKSLLSLAIEQGQVEGVFQDMTYFSEVTKVRDFELLLKSPIIKPNNKRKIFRHLFADKLGKLPNAFFDIIITKGRESYLQDITRAFIDQYRVHKGITSAKLTSAIPLSSLQIDAIKAKLMASKYGSKTIELEVSIDKDLIGGFVLEIGDKVYDASVAHKLDTFKRQFT